MVTIMVTIFWTLQIEFSIVMKQPWNLLFLNLFVPKRTENLFLVTDVECIRKFQYYLVLMLVEVLYPTYLFTNQYLVKLQNILQMKLKNQQCLQAKNMSGCQKNLMQVQKSEWRCRSSKRFITISVLEIFWMTLWQF